MILCDSQGAIPCKHSCGFQSNACRMLVSVVVTEGLQQGLQLQVFGITARKLRGVDFPSLVSVAHVTYK